MHSPPKTTDTTPMTPLVLDREAVARADWKDVAHRLAGLLDAMMLYCTYPNDSHPRDAMAALNYVWKPLGFRGSPRMAGQIEPAPHITPPLPDLSSAPADSIIALTSQAGGLVGADVREGVYVASRASIPERGRMWRDLRASGVKVNSTWIDEDGEGETGDWSELWERIEREVKASEALILYAEPDDFPLKGAFVEAGIAIAAGVPVFVVAPGVLLGSYGCRPIGSWASHPLVTYADSVEQALSAIRASNPSVGGGV